MFREFVQLVSIIAGNLQSQVSDVCRRVVPLRHFSGVSVSRILLTAGIIVQS